MCCSITKLFLFFLNLEGQPQIKNSLTIPVLDLFHFLLLHGMHSQQVLAV